MSHTQRLGPIHWNASWRSVHSTKRPVRSFVKTATVIFTSSSSLKLDKLADNATTTTISTSFLCLLQRSITFLAYSCSWASIQNRGDTKSISGHQRLLFNSRSQQLKEQILLDAVWHCGELNVLIWAWTFGDSVKFVDVFIQKTGATVEAGISAINFVVC